MRGGQLRERNSQRRKNPPNVAIRRVARSSSRRGHENLHVSPANARASKGVPIAIDERSRVGHRLTWQMRKGSEITRERLW